MCGGVPRGGGGGPDEPAAKEQSGEVCAVLAHLLGCRTSVCHLRSRFSPPSPLKGFFFFSAADLNFSPPLPRQLDNDNFEGNC